MAGDSDGDGGKRCCHRLPFPPFPPFQLQPAICNYLTDPAVITSKLSDFEWYHLPGPHIDRAGEPHVAHILHERFGFSLLAPVVLFSATQVKSRARRVALLCREAIAEVGQLAISASHGDGP